MNDRYVEVSSKSWGGRLVEAIKGVLVGLLLFVASFPLLWWNESRAAQTAKSLEEGQANVVAVKADLINPSNEGKLVHLSALATTTEVLQDNAFGVTAPALRLLRSVEMYQWVEDKKTETKKKLGGGEEKVTTYDYEKKWKDSVVKSSDFKVPAGHTNPSSMAYSDFDVLTRTGMIGGFHLPEDVIKKLTKLDPYPLDARAPAKLPANLVGKVRTSEGGYFVGADPANPQVGDLRISYKIVSPHVISLVARQVGNSFTPYKAEAGDEVLLVESGTKDAKAMFQSAQEANTMLTWILRAVGYLMMAIGLMLILRPLVIVADFIPMIGNLAGLSASLFALVAAFPLSTLVIAIAWISVRPLVGIAVLAATLLGFAAMGFIGVKAWKKRHRARVAA
jgi:hypothetical protein